MKKHVKTFSFSLVVKSLIILLLFIPISAIVINFFVIATTKSDIHDAQSFAEKNADCILVLGAGIMPDGSPSPILKERLDTAIVLYQNHASDKIIVSGGQDAAESEVSSMRNYLLKNGIPFHVITNDHYGINTFASVNNLKDIYHVQSAIIVSQRFHLYRALYIAHALNIQAVGCPTSQKNLSDNALLIREFFARIKDYSQLTIEELPQPFHKIARTLYEKTLLK